MVDNWNVVKRTEQCLSCHLGDGKRAVDHEMIAAGHPDLVFDLESYSAAMPPHWKVENDAQTVLRTWTVGQAVQLRESLRRLNRRANEGGWPEYSEFECYACHHSLVSADRSWRQKAGYPDRRPGNAPWNAAHFAVLRVIAKEVEPALSGNLEKNLAEVFRATTDLRSDRKSIGSVAGSTADAADQIVDRLKERKFQADDARRILNTLSGESERLANMGPKAAEQATMALQSLAVVSGEKGKSREFEGALKALYKELENPSNYNAAQFADQFRRAAATLR
jgi:hypothetical protein